MLCGLLPEFPSAHCSCFVSVIRARVREALRVLEKTRSSLLNHIFSTIPAIALSSTENWVYTHSGCLGGDTEKIYIRAQSSFSEFPSI